MMTMVTANSQTLLPSSIMLQINRRFVSYYMLPLRISVTSDFVRFR